MIENKRKENKKKGNIKKKHFIELKKEIIEIGENDWKQGGSGTHVRVQANPCAHMPPSHTNGKIFSYFL